MTMARSSLENYPSLVSFKYLKQSLRKGIEKDNARSLIWCTLTSISTPVSDTEKDISLIGLYEDTSLSARSLYDSITAKHKAKVDSYPILDPSINEEAVYVKETSQLLCFLLQQRPNKGRPDFFFPLIRLLVKVTSKVDMTYLILTDLLANKEKKYLDATPMGIFVTNYTFREIVKQSMPKTAAVLDHIGALKAEYLQMIFQDFCVELLPEPHVKRIVDAYLLEGIKVLYRYGLAILRGYKKLIKANQFSSGEELWLAVKTASANCGGVLLTHLLDLPQRLPYPLQFSVGTNASKLNESFICSEAITELAYEDATGAASKLKSSSSGSVLSRSILLSLRDEAVSQAPAGIVELQNKLQEDDFDLHELESETETGGAVGKGKGKGQAVLVMEALKMHEQGPRTGNSM